MDKGRFGRGKCRAGAVKTSARLQIIGGGLKGSENGIRHFTVESRAEASARLRYIDEMNV